MNLRTLLETSMKNYLQLDDAREIIMNLQNWNLYSYVKENPVNFNDVSWYFINVPLMEAFEDAWRRRNIYP